jgi:hypothetical protein
MTSQRPIVLDSSTAVSRPADRVAEFLLDWRNDPIWRSQVRGFTAEPDSRAVSGQMLVEELSFAGLAFRTPTVVGSAGPLEATYSGGSRLVRVQGHRRIVAESPSSCRVEIRTEITLLGVLAALTPVLAPSYRKTDAADVAGLPVVIAREVDQPAG